MKPVTDDSVSDNIEDGRRDDVTLGDSSCDPKGIPMVSTLFGYDLLLVPEPGQEAEPSGPHSVSRKDIQRPIPIKRVIRLPQVQKDPI